MMSASDLEQRQRPTVSGEGAAAAADKAPTQLQGRNRRSPAFSTDDRFCISVSLALCLQWAVAAANFSKLQWPIFLVVVGAVVGFGLAAKRDRNAGIFALGLAMAVGVIERIHRSPFAGSDVVLATREALRVVFSGHNPYLHVFMDTHPAGSPFPYLPGELLFYAVPYALFHSIAHVDQFAGIATIFLLASLTPFIGVARMALVITTFSTFTLVARLAVDGSNEHALAFIMIAALAALVWSTQANAPKIDATVKKTLFYASAVLLSIAILFKALAWFFVPFIAAYLLHRDRQQAYRYFAIIAGCMVAAIVPFLFPTPQGFFRNVFAGFVFHQTTWGLNLWNMLAAGGLKVDAHAQYIAPIAAMLLLCTFAYFITRKIQTLSTAIFYGLATLTPALLLARWSTAPYFTLATTILTFAIILTMIPSESQTSNRVASSSSTRAV